MMWTMLLADERFGLPDNFMQDSPQVLPPWVIVLIILGGVGIAASIFFVRRYKQYSARIEKDSIFHEICEELGVSLQHREILEEIAISEDLTSPIALLISKKTLDYHAAQFLEKQEEQKQKQFQVMIKNTRKLIFD